MRDQLVNVAMTPLGNADSVIPLPAKDSHDRAIFVKPYEISLPFRDVLSKIQAQEQQGSDYKGPTHYAQTQNDNLRNEYETLFSDVPASVSFARIALDAEPDAINFWLGNSHSTTALHKDNYENVYVQVLGRKHFVLMPPVEAACINEKSVLAATYAVKQPHQQNQHQPEEEEGGKEEAQVPPPPLTKQDLSIHLDTPEEYVPFATWDPDYPDINATPYSHLSRPLRVTLEEGDMLYLPALWYHKVSQSCNQDGICCAVNYWYDLDFSGGFWSMANFVRSVGLMSMRRQGEDEGEKEKGEERAVEENR